MQSTGAGLMETLKRPEFILFGKESAAIAKEFGNINETSKTLGFNMKKLAFLSGVSAEAQLPNLLPESYRTDFGLYFDTANVWGVDYSNAVNDSNKIRSSIGIAANVFTPIGPLSWTVSQAITKANTDKTETFNFNIGTSF